MNPDETDEAAEPDSGEVHQIRETLIPELLVNAFDALLETVPPVEALEAIEPHARHVGMALALKARRRFGMGGKGSEAVALPLYWGHLATSGNRCDPPLIYEEGAIAEVYYCPVARARPEICTAVSHHAAEGVLEAVNPEYEVLFTHHIAKGDQKCSYTIRRRAGGEPLTDPGPVLKEMEAIDEGEEERSLRAAWIWGEMLTCFTKAALELQVEDRFLEEVRTPDTVAGKQIGLFLINEHESRIEGPSGIRLAIDKCHAALLQQGSSSVSEGTVIGVIRSCPFQNAPVQVCRQIGFALDGLVRSIDPDLEFAYGEMMSQGDERCTWSVHQKGSDRVDQASPRRSDPEDPVAELSMRFARGEISEEEFNRKMTLIIMDRLPDPD